MPNAECRNAGMPEIFKFRFVEQLDCGKAPLVGELSAVPTEGFSDPKHLFPFAVPGRNFA